MSRNVLISGASVAGPALAYWLHHHGFGVTVVETAAGVRSGGYPIDLRGVAVEVVRRMGVLDELTAARTRTRRVTFMKADGRRAGSLSLEALTGSADDDIELPRGSLTSVLYKHTRDDVEYLFDDSITALDEKTDGVDVTFRGGTRRTFDLVIGADGLHSNVRALAFGPEEPYLHHLGYRFTGFTAPNRTALDHEAVIWNVPGRMTARYAVDDPDRVHAFLAFASPQPTGEELRDREGNLRLTERTFATDRWEIPQLLADLRAADDVFSDTVSQIRMPTWSTGRVAVTGDAAHATSFLSGQGTSMAVVGAYVLAGELAAHEDHAEAFTAYRRTLIDFVERNQALATGSSSLIPRTRKALWLRNQATRLLPLLSRTKNLFGRNTTRAANSLTLPDYPTRTTEHR
ncbi:FAD-dependent monooxygenase [Umezawaea sp. Da 62-37]|uniref:FAD-dependent monooxygenase n=1 Tax=Umezawaea sp. Da 62-37 TaxID=3075927 RepID=UPI0028F6F1BD|nr:FAD-dependent monooxygenase [Umezawaea sp. Da 62-37]WNV83380.1 FAD-dependent monooxygenase [Umezawaea sp. Da 62-37]